MTAKKKKQNTATQQLMEQLHVRNVMALPRLEKVVVTVGVGKRRDEKAFLEAVERDLAAITGQKPQRRPARKSVSGFHMRKGDTVGYRVTLRGKRMHDFIQRFVRATLPRVRDFRGISTTSFDGSGNLSVGLSEHLAFPEIHSDKTDYIFGVEITFVTTAKTNEEAGALFASLGFPLTVESTRQEEPALETAASRAAREREKGSTRTPKELLSSS